MSPRIRQHKAPFPWFGGKAAVAMPASWSVLPWKAHGGYGGQGKASGVNSRRERVWFSPSCLSVGLWEHTA